MFPTRRAFVQTGGLVSWSLAAPAFLTRTAFAAPDAARREAKDTILVVIELTGGNDGLNTVVPYKDALYEKYRPTLKLSPGQLKKINGELGLHPALDGLAGLLEDGCLSVVQGVGYPNPSQSHFRSMDIWQAASTAETLSEGWMGKALKSLPAVQSFHLKGNNERSPLALDGAPMRVPSIATLADFQLHTAAASNADAKSQKAIIEGAAKSAGANPLLDFVSRTAANTYASSRRLQEIGKNYQPKAPYPGTPLANKLKLAAQLIDADIGARVFYVALENFDTHAGQAQPHAALLTQLSTAITAFFKDLSARGHKERVLIMTFSEFGRRAKENGSKGTDHGSAAPMFLIGGKVKAGPIGAHPSLEKLEDGNLKHHTDFRQVYAAVLEKWLGVKSEPVLGAKYAALDLFKS